MLLYSLYRNYTESNIKSNLVKSKRSCTRFLFGKVWRRHMEWIS